MLPHNYKKYPGNVLPPRMEEIDGDIYTIHRFRFNGLLDFYSFLKKNPDINLDTFPRVSSKSKDSSFAGKPYNQAVEDLMREKDPGYQEYLKVQDRFRSHTHKIHKYRNYNSIAGGAIDPVQYTTGSPTIYKSSRLISAPKFITIDTQVAYMWSTTKSEVFNRALIITNLIRALENQGYSVDVNSFMLAEYDDELIESIFKIKNFGGRTNYQALYKSLVDVEFFRRLCFRVMEVSDVINDWNDGYGQTASKSLATKVLKLGKDDIYFDQPYYMDIKGKDIGDDFENAIHHLKLEHTIDVPKEKELIRKCAKTIKK